MSKNSKPIRFKFVDLCTVIFIFGILFHKKNLTSFVAKDAGVAVQGTLQLLIKGKTTKNSGN